MHGEPTWSFLWRKVIPPVRDAGFRCLAPDLAGFGRSDKPTDIGWYSYDRHVAMAATLLEDLDLRDATIVVHDWGGPIGLRLAVEQAERIARIVILDTGLFTGHQRMTDAWNAFRDFVARTEDLPVGMLVRGACKNDPGEEVIAAYDAPFPSAAAKAGARAFPLLIPQTPDAPGAAAGRRVLEALREDRAADADAVGRLRSRAAARGGRELRRLDRPADPARDRERLALSPGGSGAADRATDRGVAHAVPEPEIRWRFPAPERALRPPTPATCYQHAHRRRRTSDHVHPSGKH